MQFSGLVAEQVRYAEILQRAGDPEEAVRLLERSLEDCSRTAPELPGWLCGRLAALYRSLKRYDDEVRLLERYRDSQFSEDARTRFDARLSKARAIAERKRRTDTRALSSVRRVINGKEDADMPISPAPIVDADNFSSATIETLRRALIAAALREGEPGALDDAIGRVCDETRRGGFPAERMVITLKNAWRTTRRPTTVGDVTWEALYRDALSRSLTAFFHEGVR
jgi:tetratricopeptide (TPR) repeat protein